VCSCGGACVQHEVDCCKEELPYTLPSEVLQQVAASHEPQEDNKADNTAGNATSDVTGDTTETGNTDMTNDTVVATLDARAPTVNENVVEPMELDHQISSSTPAPPTGTE